MTANSHQWWVTSSVALAVSVCLGWIAQLPRLDQDELRSLAAPFSFEVMSLPESDTSPKNNVVRTHPSLQHVAGWVSAVGSSAAFGDFDEDGIENDICLTEPRTKEVLLLPAPSTGTRYRMFSLPIDHFFDSGISFPTGCIVGDFNEDGRDDLLVYFFGRSPLLVVRNPSSSDVPSRSAYTISALDPKSKTLWYTAAASQVDINGDGHIDLVFGNYFLDDARMYDPSATDTIEMQDSFSHATNAGTNRIFLASGSREGSGVPRFIEASDVFTEQQARAWTLAIGAADLDRDGLTDLYVANDYGPDHLFLNQSTLSDIRLMPLFGERSFTTPKSMVMGRDSFKGMGVDFADINADGFFDMFISNIAEEFALQESHFLWVSTGEVDRMVFGHAPYTDRGEELGVSRSYWGWDTRFGDFDNDGSSEATQATGFRKGNVNRWPELAEFAIGNDLLVHNPSSWPRFAPGDDVSGRAPNVFYARAADGRFYDIASQLGIDAPYVSRGISTSDIDGDGDLDILFSNQWEPSVLLLNQYRGENRFLGLHLLLPPSGERRRKTVVSAGHPPSPSAGWSPIGATAVVHLPDGRSQISQVDGSSGHAGSRSKAIHFGLGEVPEDGTVRVDVRYRDASGQLRDETVVVAPGWNTVSLASDVQRRSLDD